jgi:hypothetical protein
MDLQSWRNMEEIALGVDHLLSPKWNLKAHLHSFALRDRTDSWYGAGGGPNIGGSGAFVDPAGGSGRDIGRELDIEVGYKHNARTSVAAGLSWFFPGGFVKARNGGSANTQTWAFLMLQMRF